MKENQNIDRITDVVVTLETLTDEQLAKQCAEDISSFGEIVKRYESKLDTYIHRKSHAGKEDRKDILQNIFIKIYKNINDFETDLKFSSWIYRITHNEMIDWYRREKRRPTLYFEDDETILHKIISEVDIEKEVINIETSNHIKKELTKLGSDYQEIVQLRFFEEKSYEEISDILMIPPGTVATRINRVKKKLKELLHEYE